MQVLAHVGGVPIQESLIYLLPPLAIVGWIVLLARRDKRRGPPPDGPESEPVRQDDPAGSG